MKELCAAEIVNIFTPVKELWCRTVDWFSAHNVGLFYFCIGILVSVAGAFFLSWVIRHFLKRLVARTKTEIDDKIVDVIHKPLVLALLASGIVMSCQMLKLGVRAQTFIKDGYFLLISLCVTVALIKVINVVRTFFTELADKTESVYDNLLIGLIFPAVKTVVWLIAVFFITENVFHFNITALLAGAGVAAMAIAFAAQNTIANIFGAISLIADRPFVIGDMIVVNGKRGAVVSIGLRSTRLKSLDGTLWSIPNKEMSEATIENISKRPNIKQVFDFGLVYSTTPEQMQRAVDILKEIFQSCPLTDMELNPPLISFESLRDSAMNIQVVQWFQTGDFKEFCKAREAINFEVLKRFNSEGLEFAYPSQTVYIAGDSARPLKIETRNN